MERRKKRVAKADSARKASVNDGESPTYQELNRIPNIHMLKKPGWATGQNGSDSKHAELSEIASQHFWKSTFSALMILVLVFPLLAALLLTLFHYRAFPDSMMPHMFKEQLANLDETPILVSTWALAFAVFFVWSTMVCRVEHWMGRYFA